MITCVLIPNHYEVITLIKRRRRPDKTNLSSDLMVVRDTFLVSQQNMHNNAYHDV